MKKIKDIKMEDIKDILEGGIRDINLKKNLSVRIHKGNFIEIIINTLSGIKRFKYYVDDINLYYKNSWRIIKQIKLEYNS